MATCSMTSPCSIGNASSFTVQFFLQPTTGYFTWHTALRLLGLSIRSIGRDIFYLQHPCHPWQLKIRIKHNTREVPQFFFYPILFHLMNMCTYYVLCHTMCIYKYVYISIYYMCIISLRKNTKKHTSFFPPSHPWSLSIANLGIQTCSWITQMASWKISNVILWLIG